MLEALDWPSARFSSRQLLGGVSLAFSASIDALYAASEINEWAWRILTTPWQRFVRRRRRRPTKNSCG
jgi:hypothetical protein